MRLFSKVKTEKRKIFDGLLNDYGVDSKYIGAAIGLSDRAIRQNFSIFRWKFALQIFGIFYLIEKGVARETLIDDVARARLIDDVARETLKK